MYRLVFSLLLQLQEIAGMIRVAQRYRKLHLKSYLDNLDK